MAGWREAAAVTVGGAVGTGLRLALDAALPHTDTGFPFVTLLVNVVGSFVLGAMVALLWRRTDTPNWLKVALGSGLIGSFTTFSALIASLVAEAQRGLWMLAVLYLALSLVLGFAAALAGLRVARRPWATPLEIDLVDE